MCCSWRSFIKDGFLQSNLSPFLTTEIRLLGAIIFLITLKGFKIYFFLKNIEKKEQKRFLLSILLGTNIGILLQQIVFKTLPIGIGWALLSTSPVISLLFAKNEDCLLYTSPSPRDEL